MLCLLKSNFPMLLICVCVCACVHVFVGGDRGEREGKGEKGK